LAFELSQRIKIMVTNTVPMKSYLKHIHIHKPLHNQSNRVFIWHCDCDHFKFLYVQFTHLSTSEALHTWMSVLLSTVTPPLSSDSNDGLDGSSGSSSSRRSVIVFSVKDADSETSKQKAWKYNAIECDQTCYRWEYIDCMVRNRFSNRPGTPVGLQRNKYNMSGICSVN